jgi:hypothetical protein
MIALAPGTVNATRDGEKVKIQDDCDPTDPNWAPTGGVLPFGEDLKVLNTGGRNHTFTEVANFGGGNVPPLSTGLALAPECPGAQVLPAGGRTDVSGLNAGLHKFQCCIHPWMRTVVSVE